MRAVPGVPSLYGALRGKEEGARGAKPFGLEEPARWRQGAESRLGPPPFAHRLLGNVVTPRFLGLVALPSPRDRS